MVDRLQEQPDAHAQGQQAARETARGFDKEAVRWAENVQRVDGVGAAVFTDMNADVIRQRSGQWAAHGPW